MKNEKKESNNNINTNETSLLDRYIQRKMVYNIEQLDEKEIAKAIKTLLQSNKNYPKHLN
jgi:hypothetical protein